MKEYFNGSCLNYCWMKMPFGHIYFLFVLLLICCGTTLLCRYRSYYCTTWFSADDCLA